MRAWSRFLEPEPFLGAFGACVEPFLEPEPFLGHRLESSFSLLPGALFGLIFDLISDLAGEEPRGGLASLTEQVRFHTHPKTNFNFQSACCDTSNDGI